MGRKWLSSLSQSEKNKIKTKKYREKQKKIKEAKRIENRIDEIKHKVRKLIGIKNPSINEIQLYGLYLEGIDPDKADEIIYNDRENKKQKGFTHIQKHSKDKSHVDLEALGNPINDIVFMKYIKNRRYKYT